MSSEREIEYLEIGDLVILPDDEERAWRPVLSTESCQVFGEKKPGYYVTVRGIPKAYFGYEGELLPYLEPET